MGNGGKDHSEGFAQKVLDASLNGVYVHDVASGKNVFINRQYTELTGYTLADLQRMDRQQFFELFHPDDRARVAEHMNTLLSGVSKALEIEYRFKTKDGRWIWCLSRDNVFDPGPQGTISRLIGTFLDITDRRTSEQMLRESEHRYRELVQHANSAIIRWRRDGTLTFFNEYAEAFFGYSADEILGKHVKLLAPRQESTGTDLSGLAQDIVDHPGRFISNINENIRRDGRRVWMAWTNRAILDAAGRVTEILAIGSDITRQKEAEEALREANNQIRSILERITDGFLALDRQWKITYFNEPGAGMIGMKREELIGGSLWELFPHAVSTRFYTEYHHAIERQTPVHFEEYYPEPLNIWVECHAYPSAEGLSVFFRDVSERKQAEAVLREYSQKLEMEVKSRTAEIEEQYRQLEEMNEFIKEMTQHTIQTMENDREALSRQIHETIGGDLAAIKMMLEAGLYTKDKMPQETRKASEKIIGHLRNTMKEVRRITHRMRSQVLDQFGLAAAIEEDLRYFQKSNPGMVVDFQNGFAGRDVSNEIQTVLYRVFQEGLNNIVKHSGADSLKIELKESEDRIALTIRDNGRGFDVRRVLETRTALSGYGLLSMQERVGICNGKFEVRSEPGKGTRLQAFIPKTGS